MYTSRDAMFIYSVSPVHMGAGTALGAIDNPIQRERHTEHPMIAGSGIKGAFRHHAEAAADKNQKLIEGIFGPPTDSAKHAGAISFSDGQIVLFPVRSLRESYVYATCPTALARLQRLLGAAGVAAANDWKIPQCVGDQCAVPKGDELLVDGKLILEVFEFEPQQENAQKLLPIAHWLAEHALPQQPAFEYFSNKMRGHTVLLSDDRFSYFVRNATVVEPHVRIEDETGTASDGGLFYTENLPPEALLVSLAMASKTRQADESPKLDAPDVLHAVRAGREGFGGMDGKLVQIGGDASTGRGQVVVRFAGSEVSHG